MLHCDSNLIQRSHFISFLNTVNIISTNFSSSRQSIFYAKLFFPSIITRTIHYKNIITLVTKNNPFLPMIKYDFALEHILIQIKLPDNTTTRFRNQKKGKHRNIAGSFIMSRLYPYRPRD